MQYPINRWCIEVVVALSAGLCAAAWAQPSPAQAAAAAGTAAGGSTSANGGTGGVGLGGTGPAVSGGTGASIGAGVPDAGRSMGSGALVGPRARKEANDLMLEKPELREAPPRTAGERALMLEKERRATDRPFTPAR